MVGSTAKRAELDAAATPADVLAVLGLNGAPAAAADATPSRTSNLILTVCGNGLGTSLFLKNTLEQVLGTWGWAPFITVEATDTISANGRAKEAEPAHRRSVELNPDAPLLRMNLGQALLAEDDPAKVDEALAQLHKASTMEPDNAFVWLLLSQAYDRKGQAGMARLAAAEQNFSLGQGGDAKMFAMRARQQLAKDSPEWRRATDIVLVSNPTKEDLRALAQEGSTNQAVKQR